MMGGASRRNKDELYLIGEVSRMGGISQRTLRHYDELGLIEPDEVGDNGYRYYNRATILKIPVIHYFKMMGFSLDEIAAMMKSGDIGDVHRQLLERLCVCDEEAREIAERKCAIKDWSDLVDEANYVLRSRPETVSVKYLSSSDYICLPSTFGGDFADAIVSLEFAAFVKDADNAITGPVILGFDSVADAVASAEQREVCDVRLLQKAMRPVKPENVWTSREGLYLSAYHIGDFERLGTTFQRMIDFADEHGYRLSGGVLERFVTDYWTSYNPDFFVAEILLPTETE